MYLCICMYVKYIYICVCVYTYVYQAVYLINVYMYRSRSKAFLCIIYQQPHHDPPTPRRRAGTGTVIQHICICIDMYVLIDRFVDRCRYNVCICIRHTIAAS